MASLGSRYLVISDTGEVFATDSHSSPTPTPHMLEGYILRPDWYAYINNILTSTSRGGISTYVDPDGGSTLIMSQVRSKDCVSAPSGINRAWRDKVSNATTPPPQGASEAILVAQRVVLNSCALNR